MNRRVLSLVLFVSIFRIHDAFASDMDAVNVPLNFKISSIFLAEDSPVSVGFVGPGIPQTLNAQSAQNDLVKIIDEWNSVSCSSITLVLSEKDSMPDIPIYWGDNRTNDCIPSDTDIGFTYFSPCLDGDFTYERNSILLNSNPRYDWRHESAPYQEREKDRVVDLSSVLTHEIGHALGLQHSEVPLSTMFAKYLIDGGMRSLSADDKFKLCALYPQNKTECRTDADCGDGTCESKGQFSVCEERRSADGEYCVLDNLTCRTCLITSPETFTGYCTSPCDDTSSCNDGLTCGTDGFCLLEITEAPDQNCSTSPNQSHFALFIFAILLTRKRRRKNNGF